MNREQAIAFVSEQAKAIGMGFHPDEPFGDYLLNDQPSFDAATAAELDAKMAQAFAALGDDVYEVVIAALRPFPFGQVLATPGALAAVGEEGVGEALHRHGLLEQGALCGEDHKANARAVREGGRILSSFVIKGTKVWCITEHDRSATTVLLPSEY